MSSPLKPQLRMVVSYMWVLGMEPMFSARAAGALTADHVSSPNAWFVS